MKCKCCGEKLTVVRYRCVAQEQGGQPKDGWLCPQEGK